MRGVEMVKMRLNDTNRAGVWVDWAMEGKIPRVGG